MRFVSFTTSRGATSVGVVTADGWQVADLGHAAYRALVDTVTPSMQRLLDGDFAKLVDRLGSRELEVDSLIAIERVTLDAPVPRPSKIIGAAYNFRDALAERDMAPHAEPVTFFRSGRTTIGPGVAIRIPPDVGNVGYEGELAVIIGRRAIDVPRDRAMRHVAGYTVHNDVSGSAMTKADNGRFVRGKNMPASSPLGPWLVSADAIADPHALRIRLAVDARVLQDGSTASMLFDIPALIEHISHRMPLEPGDVIATGTPAGVAVSHTPPAWLLPGQTVTVDVDGIGRLVNPIEAGVPYLETP